ncbi:amino acid permease [Simkania sp.]|uniref:amino acid permease n=1 Tax=Simkania sp. TaxID=34094 RepID=UPI003B51F250
MSLRSLARFFPRQGGPYVFCREGYGDFVGFQVAYNYWVSMWIGNAGIAVAFTGYLSTFIPELNHSNLLAFCVTAGAVWVLTIVNIIGIHFAGFMQLILTILKFVPLVIIAIIGLFFVDWSNLAYFNVSGKSNFSAFSGGAMMTLWAFLGVESASVPADDVKDPKKTIPRATILATTLAAVLYIICTIVIMGVIPIPQLKDSAAPFADLAGKIFGEWGKFAMGAVAVISCLGALNGWILLTGQIPLAAAKDNLFPKKFGKVSKTRAPVFGVVVSSILVTALLFLNFSKNLVDQFTFIILLGTLAAILAYIYSTIAEFVIYIKHPDKVDKASVVKSLTISGLAFLYTFWMVISSGEEIVFYGALLMFTSIPVYGWMEWKKYQKKFVGV